MKTTLLLTTVFLALSLTPQVSGISLNPDFLTGFESGIFLRDNNELDNYGCPEPRPAGPLQNVKEMMMPIKMMSGFMQDKNVEQMISTVELFVQSLSSLMAVFTNYEGGEFCSGLIFGANGAAMLTNIAKTLLSFQKMSSEPGKNPMGNPFAAMLNNSMNKGSADNNTNNNRSAEGKRPTFRRNGN